MYVYRSGFVYFQCLQLALWNCGMVVLGWMRECAVGVGGKEGEEVGVELVALLAVGLGVY